MRTWKWMITACLLAAFSAMAQQTTAPASSSEAPMPPAQQLTNPPPAETPAPSPAAAAAPTTMDQVVDRAIEREHGLITFLKTRTPLVETYLQNMKLDPAMGPTPIADHYFLGRLDLSDSVDREDYISRDSSLENRLMGGVTKLFKFEYKPIGFSWMIFAYRDDFDRAHYNFRYVHR